MTISYTASLINHFSNKKEILHYDAGLVSTRAIGAILIIFSSYIPFYLTRLDLQTFLKLLQHVIEEMTPSGITFFLWTPSLLLNVKN